MRRDRIEAYKWFLIARDNGVRRSVEAARILGAHLLRHERVRGRGSRPRLATRENTLDGRSLAGFRPDTKKAGPKQDPPFL